MWRDKLLSGRATEADMTEILPCDRGNYRDTLYQCVTIYADDSSKYICELYNQCLLYDSICLSTIMTMPLAMCSEVDLWCMTYKPTSPSWYDARLKMWATNKDDAIVVIVNEGTANLYVTYGAAPSEGMDLMDFEFVDYHVLVPGQQKKFGEHNGDTCPCDDGGSIKK